MKSTAESFRLVHVPIGERSRSSLWQCPETSMKWEEVPESERANVIAALEREAERLEQDAEQLQAAAKQLGRPSLVERQELKANAFRAGIEFLTRARG
jgi:hypothetical protein